MIAEDAEISEVIRASSSCIFIVIINYVAVFTF
jgi:hypothetical protein